MGDTREIPGFQSISNIFFGPDALPCYCSPLYSLAVDTMEVKPDFKFELTDLNYQCCHISMAPTCHYLQDHCYGCLSKMASEAADEGHF